MLEHSTERVRDGAWVSPAAAEARDETLQLLFEINERGLHLMAQSIASHGESRGGPVNRGALRAAWHEADAPTLTRAATFPALLLDVGDWNAGAIIDARGFFPDICAIPLMRSTLTMAWHLCRTDRHRASILLGLTPDSITALSQLRLQDLERIALSSAHTLRPRWNTSPSMWSELLKTARGGDARAFEEFKLHALQRMIGDLLPAQADIRNLPRRCSRA